MFWLSKVIRNRSENYGTRILDIENLINIFLFHLFYVTNHW